MSQLLAIALIVLVIALGASGFGQSICPRPVHLDGRIVACDGVMPSPDPTPRRQP